MLPAPQHLPAIRDPVWALAGYPSTAAEAPGILVRRASYSRFWRIVYKRKWLIAQHRRSPSLPLARVRTLMQTPLYTATVRLQIDRNIAKIVRRSDSVMPSRLRLRLHAHAIRAAEKPKHG